MWQLTASNAPYIYSGHIYLCSFVQPTCAVYRQNVPALPAGYKVYPAPTVETRQEFLVQASDNRAPSEITISFAGIISKHATTEESYALKDKQIFDLTQMFGATVAQHFLDLETATAGAGVALFRQMFPESYYPYNVGELVSVQTSCRKTVGFNQWDEVWESGNISSNTGVNIVTTLQIRSKNYLRVMPNTTYYFKSVAKSGGGYAYYYDKNKAFVVGGISITRNSSFTTPAGVCYMRFVEGQSYGTAYNHDICINISDPSRNGTYEPYSAHTYPLGSTLTLRGIPVLTDGKVAYDGDQYAPDGTVTRRYGIGQMTYEYINGLNEDYIGYDSARNAVWVRNWNYTDLAARKKGGINAICNICEISAHNIDIFASQYRIYFLGFNSVEDFKAKIQAQETSGSGLYIVYELATSTAETADPYESLQIAGSTEEFIDAGERDVAVPVGVTAGYYNAATIDLDIDVGV